MDYFDHYPRAPEYQPHIALPPEYDTRGVTYRSVHFSARRHAEGRSNEVLFTASLRPTADIGLRCRTAGTFDGPGNVRPLDETFSSLIQSDCAASDTDLARTLLSPEVRGALLRANEFSNGIVVTDRDVAVLTVEYIDDRLFEAFGDSLASAALAMQRELAGLPSPTPLRRLGLDAATSECAAAYGLTMHAHPLRLGGWLHGDPFWLVIFAQPGETASGAPRDRGAYLSLRFREPLGPGLRLKSAHWRDRAANALGAHDLLVGDEPFDRAWRIDARDRELARAMLTPAARKTITELAAQKARLTLTDDGLGAEFDLPFRPAQLRSVLAAVHELRDALRPEPPSAGPYR